MRINSILSATITITTLLAGCKSTRDAAPPAEPGDGLSRNAAAMEAYLAASETLPLIQRSDWINVKTDITPAAVGDGMADDTAALQAAFARLDDKSTAPRIFYFPPGTYRITDTLTLTVSAVKHEGHAAEKIKIDGYAGQISYCRANIWITTNRFVGKSDDRCLLLLMGDAFRPQPPILDLNGGKSISLGNLVWNFDDKSQEVSLPDAPFDKTTFDAVNASMDHLRELSMANLEK